MIRVILDQFEGGMMPGVAFMLSSFLSSSRNTRNESGAPRNEEELKHVKKFEFGLETN